MRPGGDGQTRMIILGIILFYAVPGLVLLWLLWAAYVEHRRDRVPILLYHRLLSKADAEAGRVPDDEMIWVSYDTSFAAQMRYLDEAGYTTLDFDEYVAIRVGEKPLPAKPVIVTFDDGYLSNYRMGYPVLKELGFKATIYVPLEPDEHTSTQVEGVDSFLTTEQIRELSENDISIQSHTLTHCILTELNDGQAKYELGESRRRLENITGRPVKHIAIPRSGYSRRIRRLVIEAGYESVCCNNKGSASGLSDLLALPRIVVERDMALDDFKQCLTPRAALILRIVGNIKRIPERLGGATFARQVRDILYIKPLRPLFKTRNLKHIVLLVALVYLVGCIGFTWYLLAF